MSPNSGRETPFFIGFLSIHKLARNGTSNGSGWAVENGFGSVFVLNDGFWFGFFTGGCSFGGHCCTEIIADPCVHLLDGDGRQTRADEIGGPVDCQRGHGGNQAGEAAFAVLTFQTFVTPEKRLNILCG